MRYTTFLAIIFSVLTLGTTATAQDYWEYDALENEWERNVPYAGVKYEYDADEYWEEDEFLEDDYVDVESEQYEYEPGEGYHEQEWYDPSDWFEVGSDIDYEYDDDDYDFDAGYYDDGFYDDDWYYDYYE